MQYIFWTNGSEKVAALGYSPYPQYILQTTSKLGLHMKNILRLSRKWVVQIHLFTSH